MELNNINFLKYFAYDYFFKNNIFDIKNIAFFFIIFIVKKFLFIKLSFFNYYYYYNF